MKLAAFLGALALLIAPAICCLAAGGAKAVIGGLALATWLLPGIWALQGIKTGPPGEDP